MRLAYVSEGVVLRANEQFFSGVGGVKDPFWSVLNSEGLTQVLLCQFQKPSWMPGSWQ